MNLQYIRENRGMNFVKRGMKVQAIDSGKFGVITSGNRSGNLNVRMEGQKYPVNRHPQWMMRYFDANDNVIVEYKD